MAAVSLQDRGWYLSDEGISQCSQNGKSDPESIIRSALNVDLRDIGKKWLPEEVNRGKADCVQGPGVLQLQKIRNVSAPKDNEESQGAPRLMKLSLTDGHITCSAVETEILNGISLSTPPGTKIQLTMTVDVEHGFLLLNNKNSKSLGGRVDKLAEGWELKRKLAKQARVANAEGGPPPFVPFGQRISNESTKQMSKRDNFKSLETLKSERVRAEEDEFEQQRQATIAEAQQAKQEGAGKKFGGGNKVSDDDVARIIDMGFNAESAVAALKQKNGDVEMALESLLSGEPPRGIGRGSNRQSGFDSDRGGRGGRGGRRERKDEGNAGRGRRGREEDEEVSELNSKPSAPASLFDFLKEKIPESKKEARSSSSRNNTNAQSDAGYRDKADHTESTYRSKEIEDASVPPRFSQKPRQQNNSQFNTNNGPPNNRNDRNDSQRPRTAHTDSQNNKRTNDRNFNDKSYSDRNENRRQDEDRYRRNRDSESQDVRRNQNSGKRDNDDNRPDSKQANRENTSDTKLTDRYQRTESNQSTTSNAPGAKTNKGRSQNSSQASSRGKNEEKNISASAETSRNQTQKQSQGDSRQKSKPKDNYKGSNRSDNSANGQNRVNSSQSNANGNSSYGQDSHAPAGAYNDYSHKQGSRMSASQYPPNFAYTDMVQLPGSGFPMSLKQGDRVMARYWEDGLFYEAQIAQLPPNLSTCVVTFTEYGNTEEVLLQDVRPHLPQMTLHLSSVA
ncbi:tudor domain-containing protein 3-like isoform X2 [Dreissena polymorpha]|uniref:tudor domain-containing protein 3-like isoform X2 n=1 Tax=Dreissena polymorpha TaxID=45954 RepID=UPI002264EA4E|nr:tudor domain-containing protein 3-like isoform X2 [Dreissena polymorpha]